LPESLYERRLHRERDLRLWLWLWNVPWKVLKNLQQKLRCGKVFRKSMRLPTSLSSRKLNMCANLRLWGWPRLYQRWMHSAEYLQVPRRL
jgi:hypothetical protein